VGASKIEIRQDIQFLRGLAVLVVVLFHLQVPFFENGFLGVDIFFVVSGFLMAKLYDRDTILGFYKRRLDRLYPAYATTLFFTLAVAAFVTIPVDFNQVFDQIIAGSFFLSNVYHWSQNSYFDGIAFNPLLNLWSLSVEVQFYLLVPFLYPFLRHRKWAFFLVFAVSLASCFAIQTISPKTSFFQMPLRIWEFLIGAYVAWWSNTSPAPSLKFRSYSLISLISLATLVLSLFVLKLKPDAVGTILYGHPALPALTVALLTGLVIKYGIDAKTIEGLAGRLFVRLGDHSYSIYLVHFPIIVLLNYVPFGGTRLAMDGNVSLAVALLLMVFASAVSYVFVEGKFSSWLNALKVRLTFFVAIIASAFALADINLSQYNAVERNIFSASTDRDTYRCGKIFRILNPFDIVCSVGGANEAKGILLIGNSHADSIKKVLSDKAAEYKFATFFVVANDPLLGGNSSPEQFVNIAVERNVKALVLHYTNDYHNEKFRAELAKLVNLAKSKGVKVSIIAPVPIYDVHVPQAMFKDSADKKALALTREQHLARTQKFREFVAGFETLGVEIYDPSEFLCQSEAGCLVSTADSKPYYFDTDHLTLTGASLLKPLFDRLLSRI
jgi:peptidoglycan/LPS O-acetylase OafA/YrhL